MVGVGVGFGVGEAVGETVGFGVGLGVGDTVGEKVGFGVGFGETVAEAVGFGVGLGVGDTVGGATTGTDPKNVNSSKTPVGVLSKDASTAVAGAVPATGIRLAKKLEAEIKPGPSPRSVPNCAQFLILLRVPFSTKNSLPEASLTNCPTGFEATFKPAQVDTARGYGFPGNSSAPALEIG